MVRVTFPSRPYDAWVLAEDSEKMGPRWKWLMVILTVTVSLGLLFTGAQRLVESRSATPATAPIPTPSATPTPAPTPSPTAATTALRVVGLGDSVPAGINCDCDNDTYVTYVDGFGHLLRNAQTRPVRVDNLALGGARSQDVLDDWDTRLRVPVSTADVVVMTVGANDLSAVLEKWQDTGDCDESCWRPAVEEMGDRVDRIVRRIAATQPGPAPKLILTDYWNVFSDGTASDDENPGYKAWSRELSRAVNARLRESAKVGGGECVDLYSLFNGEDGQGDPTKLLASDGDHPNAAGNAVISGAVLAAYLAESGSPTPSPTPS